MQPYSKSPAQQRHRRDLLVQIWLPLGAALLLTALTLAFTILAAVRGGSTVQQGSSISVIYLIILWSLGALVQLALLVASIWLLARLYRKLPIATGTVYQLVEKMRLGVRNFTRSISHPVIQTKSRTAGIRLVGRKLRSLLNK